VSVVVVALLVVGAVIVFGGTKSASAEVIDAVNSTLGDKTAHVDVTLAIKAAGADVTGHGSGGMDFTTNALQLQLTIGVDGQQVPITADYLGGVIYENIPGLGQLTPGKSWISIDLSSLSSAAAKDPTTSSIGNNPAVMLHMLAQQGNKVVPLGPSTVDGVAVNGYSVTVNPATIAQQLKKANLPSWIEKAAVGLKVQNYSVKVFVDSSDTLRSLEVQTTATKAQTGPVSVDETLGFSDYGTPVTVTTPPADQVESFQQFLQAESALGGTSS